MTCNVATLNFGGINESPMEFIDTSNSSSRIYFNAATSKYNDLKNTPWGNVRTVLNEYFDNNQILENMLEAVNVWFATCIDDELLNNLSDNADVFDFGECSMNNVFQYILTKDKGIGGFEQCNSTRASNVPLKYKDFINGVRKLDVEKFKQALSEVYIDITGPTRVTRSNSDTFDGPPRSASFKCPTIKFEKENPFSCYFLKGRKEGDNNTTKNYYKEDHVAKIQELYSNGMDMCFEHTGRIILALFDIISFKIANSYNLPIEFDDCDRIIQSKSDILGKYLQTFMPDLLFLTEYKLGSFVLDSNCDEVFEDSELSNYSMICGEVTDGLCNAIIFRNSFGYFTKSDYSASNDDKEYKEVPLVISNNSCFNPITLVCYHAGGRGVLEKVSDFSETNLYRFVDSLESQVIVGGDFNCSLADNSGEIDPKITLFPSEQELNTTIKYSTYKERTPLQAQFDKTGKRDSKVKDGFIFKNIFNTRNGKVSMFNNTDSNVGLAVVPEKPNDSVLLPNINHPFDHFVVSCSIDTPSCIYGGIWGLLKCVNPFNYM